MVAGTELKIYFSDFFSVARRTVERYGALDISLIADLPLSSLFNSRKKKYRELHDRMIDYLRFLRDKSANDALDAGLLRAWYRFKGSIEGVVINNTTNQPIVGAQVTATRIGTPPPPQPAGAQVPSGIVGGVTGGVIAAGRVTVGPNGVPVQPVQIALQERIQVASFRFAIWNQARICCVRLQTGMPNRNTTRGQALKAACRHRST